MKQTALLLLAATCLAPGPAHADTELTAASKKVYEEAVAAANKSDWALCRTRAIGVWQQIQSPTVAGMLGICEAELGMHKDAAEHLDFFLKNQKKADPHPLREAQTRFDAARKKVARLTIVPTPDDAEITVNGKTVGTGRRTVFVDPGDVLVGASKMGQGRQRTVALLAGADETVQVEVPKEPDAGGAGAGGAGAGGAGAGGAGAGGAGAGGAGGTGQGGGSPVPGPEPAPLWPAVVLGVGGGVFLAAGVAMLVGGAVVRGNVLDRADGLVCATDPACQDNESELATARTLGTAGVIGLAVGAVALGGMGLYLGLTNDASDARAVGVVVGPGTFLLRGSF
jgi:hypothetical protein